jgi:hypothetical protein
LFNHVHCGQTICWPASQSAIGAVEHGSADVPAQSNPPAPAAAEYCLLCAVIHLAGNVLPALAPASSISAAIGPGPVWSNLSIVLAATPHQIFQARAPPLA